MKQKIKIDPITSLLKQEEELRRSRNQLELIIQNVSDGITVQDEDGIIFANQAAALFEGYSSPKDMVGVPLKKATERFNFLDERESCLKLDELPVKRALKGEIDVEDTYRCINKVTGEDRWITVKARPIFDDLGKVRFVITITRDMTCHIQADEDKDSFINMASHELKTPITSIKAFAQIINNMLKNRGNEKVKAYFLKMDRQINKLTQLIDDLLNVTRLQQGRLEFNNTLFSFDSMVKDTVENLQPLSNGHKLILKGKTGKKIYADRSRIGQILTNMIINAVKYSPDANKVIISLLNGSDKIRVAVRDFGIGISSIHHKKIFEQFYRVPSFRDKPFPGIGLGLYVSSEIAKKYGGKMWVESQEGQGSTFFLSLPVYSRRRKR